LIMQAKRHLKVKYLYMNMDDAYSQPININMRKK